MSFKSKEKKKTFHTVKTKKMHPSRPILMEVTKGRIKIILHRNLEMQEGQRVNMSIFKLILTTKQIVMSH